MIYQMFDGSYIDTSKILKMYIDKDPEVEGNLILRILFQLQREEAVFPDGWHARIHHEIDDSKEGRATLQNEIDKLIEIIHKEQNNGTE